jgi:hypothetical protein
VGFVVDKVALGQVFSEYFDFPANLYSTKFSTITITQSPTAQIKKRRVYYVSKECLNVPAAQEELP